MSEQQNDGIAARSFGFGAEYLQRAFDLGVAISALVVLAPLMLMIGVAIILEGGRPIFFRQHRLGRNGRLFWMFKFRKFHATAGTGGLPLTMKNDPRMTSVGWILERTKCDELPQLWNVVKGEMSIVGPRPETPNFGDMFTGRFLRLFDHKPGILGPSQALLRDEASLYPDDVEPTAFYRAVLFPTKAKIDLDYYSCRTVWSDLRWLLRGVSAVIGWKMAPFLAIGSTKAQEDDRGLMLARERRETHGVRGSNSQ